MVKHDKGKAAILVVDDDEQFQRMMHRVLEWVGDWHVVCVANAQEALAAMEGQRFDAALIDIMMPGMSGLDLLTSMAERDPDMTKVIVTAFSTEENAIEALNAGAWAYITKPFQAKRLVVTARQAVERTKIRRKLRQSELKYRSLVEYMPSGLAVYVVDASQDKQRFLLHEVNHAAERITGRSAEELIGQDVIEVFPGIVSMGLLDVFREVHETGEAQVYGPALYDDGGLVFWAINWVYRLPDGELVAIFHDISTIMQANEELRHSNAMLEDAIQLVAEYFEHLTQDGKMTCD